MFRRWYDIERDLAVMDEFRRRLEGIFEDISPGGATRLSGSWPLANLYDEGTKLVAVLEVPGLKKEDLEIEVHGDALTVSGERKLQGPEGYRVHRKERRLGKFSRSFGLPSRVDVEKTKATLRNGLLVVTLEKAKEEQPRKIAVSSN